MTGTEYYSVIIKIVLYKQEKYISGKYSQGNTVQKYKQISLLSLKMCHLI